MVHGSDNLKKNLKLTSIIILSIILLLSLVEYFYNNISSFVQASFGTDSFAEIIEAFSTFLLSVVVVILVILSIGYFLFKYKMRTVLQEKEEVEKMFRLRTKELKQKNKDLLIAKKEMDDILENVKEGLFLIDKDYLIESQYSAALEGILSKKDLAKTSFIDYFSNKLKSKEVQEIKEYLDILFDSTIDDSLIDELNPLSTKKLEFSYTKEDTITKYLTFEFGRIIQDGTIIKIIASVSDITEKLILERNLELSRREVEQRTNRLQVILSIEPAMLKEFIISTKDELSILNKIIKDKSAVDEGKLNGLFRSIHVIKGNASLLGFSFFADHANEIEDFISEIHKEKNYTIVSMYNLKCLIVGLNDLYHELKTLIERLEKFLEQFKGDKDEDYVILIKSLEKFVAKVSQEQNVNIKLKTNKFDNELIPPKYRLIIKDILVQLVRNSIHHGIEQEEERLSKKKNKQAVIDISSCKIDNGICIEIRDDGRGLQELLLREKAIASGNWDPYDVHKWDKQQVFQSIFTPGISTAEEVSNIAGRGVGMDVIKNKLELINGTIRIDSKEGHHTLFTIEIPNAVKVDKKEIALASLS